MRKRVVLLLATIAPRLLAIVTGLPLLAADAAKLTPGAALPPIEAQTLSGAPAHLPRDASGHGMVIVFGFTKAAAKITRPWLEACHAAAAAAPPGSSAAVCYDVRMLEDVPKMLRGMTEHGMKSGYPPELQKMTLLVYADNDAWRQRLAVDDAKTAYVIGCDAAGVVRGLATGSYVDSELKRILQAMQPNPQ